MPRQRIHFPATLPGAAKFSGDAELNDPVLLVRAFEQETAISAPLMQAANALESACGRPRMPGSWVLVAVGFIASRQVDIQPFHDRASEGFWLACGFERRPSYSTTHARLTELEELVPEIEDAISRMVTRYVEIEPRIGRHVHIDGTEADTHSRFHHDCHEDEYCAWRREGESVDDVNERVLGRASTEAAQRRRQLEDAGEADGEAEETVLGSVRAPGEPGSSAEGSTSSASASSRGRLFRVRTSNHSWLTHDPDAGFRSYRKPNGKLEGWHGYYHLGAIDDFTGLTLFGHVASSSRTEHSQYEEILRGVIHSLNTPDRRALLEDDELTLTEALRGSDARLPEAITGDRGFAYPFIYAQNTRLGIQTVTPWRKFADARHRPTEIALVGGDGVSFVVDADGVIHCKHCRGPTKRVELRRAKNENPRLLVKCLLPSPPGSPCRKLQSVPCELDWRMLTELPRNDARYHALESRFQFERSHHLRRIRNRSGAKDPLLRPKRLGRAWQQLQLSIGTMVDWLRAGIKHGWLRGTAAYSKRVRDAIANARRQLEAQVAKKSEARRLERQALGLDRCLPSGPERPPP